MLVAIGASSWLAYRGVRGALQSEFERRIERVAATAAHEIAPGDIAESRIHQEGGGYLAIQVQLVTLRAATGVANASLIDTAHVTLVDARASEVNEGLTSPLDSLARGALIRSLAGDTTISQPFDHEGQAVQAGFAPVRDEHRRVVGVVAVEAAAAYLAVVARLAKTLTLITLVTMLATLVLAAFVIRGAASAARLELRLSRAENLAAMGRLTATLAHEIKNPLAIIRGSAQRLGKLEPEAQRMAEFVIGEVDRLSSTVARYLDFARGESAATASPAAPGDAIQALDATLGLLEGEFKARRVALERPAGLPPSAAVRLDNESMKQVYLNLVLNALEAMPEGGRLVVAVAERRGRIEVSFADSGPGMPPEVRERLGSPFYTTKAQGTGLGLFLTRRLVQAAGGELDFESSTGRGTTCTVRLPRLRA